jgi:hypothetical protein
MYNIRAGLTSGLRVRTKPLAWRTRPSRLFEVDAPVVAPDDFYLAGIQHRCLFKASLRGSKGARSALDGLI